MATIVLVFAIAVCLICIALRSGFVPVNYLCWILIAEATVHIVKRAIFLIGPQGTAEYFSAQVILVGTILVGALFSFPRINRIPATLRWLTLFGFIGLATTALGAEPWEAKAASVVDYVIPSLLFPIALLVRTADLGKIGKCYLALLAAAVPYGLLQFFTGPTFLDRAWAFGAGETSTQAGFVLRAIDGTLQDLFRPYSFYADPLTFGLFACAAVGVISAARAVGKLSRSAYVLGIFLSVIAALVTLSRSSSLGIVATFGIYLILGSDILRKPKVLLVLFVGAFLGANSISEFLSQNYADLNSDEANAIASRFETTGTLSDRSHSLELLPELFTARNLPGRGYAYSRASGSRGFDVEVSPLMGSHNVVIGVMLATGLLGITMFSMFLGRLFKDGLSLAAMPGGTAKAMRWLAACLCAHLTVGLLSGHTVLDMHFFLIAGILAGGGAYAVVEQRRIVFRGGLAPEFEQLSVGGLAHVVHCNFPPLSTRVNRATQDQAETSLQK